MNASRSTLVELPVKAFSLFSEVDIRLFLEGKHHRLYEKFGAHLLSFQAEEGVYFAVWAPQALRVAVLGDFNQWHRRSHTLLPRWDQSGIWEGFIPGLKKGDLYKYMVQSSDGEEVLKADPFAIRNEKPPQTASIVWNLDYQWQTKNWAKTRLKVNDLQKAQSVYELHLGSWRRDPADPERVLTAQELAPALTAYILEMGFTHVEFMPVMDHPYYPSWGYQITGYFAFSGFYGIAQDLMFLIDHLHQHQIGVILDWVPSHFPGDAHGLFKFDGSHLYEHADMRKGFHPDWKSYIFNYDRPEVRAFLISNACFWIDRFQVDAFRVDAVASMLYFNFSRNLDESASNVFGGHENLGAIQFLKHLNKTLYENFPGLQTIAEESTTFPGVTKPVHLGGLGFGMKWMMGWMNDSLKYFKEPTETTQAQHGLLSFSLSYAFDENFMLPLSHDEVVHGKSPMLYKMPGLLPQKFALLKVFYTYMFTHPGTKLLFMGNEFGVTKEWCFGESLNWDLLNFNSHKGLQQCVKALNGLYRDEKALHQYNFKAEGFEWLLADLHDQKLYVYLRKGKQANEQLLVILNFSAQPQPVELPIKGKKQWKVIFRSDAQLYDGKQPQKTEIFESHKQGLSLKIPAFTAIILKMYKP